MIIPSVQDVDAAVRSVLAERLQTAGDAEVFTGRLLSLRHAETFATGIRRVRVAPGTVVTPLARDFLKRLGVEVGFIARVEVEGMRDAGAWGFVIETKTGVSEAFRRTFLDGQDAWRELGRSLDDALGWVAGAEGRGALVLTDVAAVAVYRGCRVDGVRAAAADEPSAVGRAVRALGVNLLVVEPAGKSIALLRQIAASFRRERGPVAPEWVRSPRGGLLR
jgi:hypothetical protein